MLILKRQIQSLIGKGAFTKAIGLAAEYVRRNPGCAAGYHLVAMAEEAAGYTKAALQTIAHAIELEPGRSALRIMRARLLVKDLRVREAIADVEAIIALSDPDRDAGQLNAAVACREELLARLPATAPQRNRHPTAGTGTQPVV